MPLEVELRLRRAVRTIEDLILMLGTFRVWTFLVAPANVSASTSFNCSLFSAQATKVKRKYQAIVTGKSSGGSEKPSDKKFPQRSKKLPFKVRFNMESGGAKQVEQNRKAAADETVAAVGNAPQEPKPTIAKAPAVTCPILACLAFCLGQVFLIREKLQAKPRRN